MIVLVLNCGSSSLKYQLLRMSGDNEYSVLAKGIVERIGQQMGDVTYKVEGKGKHEEFRPIPDHTKGIKCILDLLVSEDWGVISSLEDIQAVGHRVAHGGEIFEKSCIIDDVVIAGIEELSGLAPLHNPANLLGIKAVMDILPEVPQVAVFDTSFHLTMPDYVYMYAIPYEYYQKYRIRRYGFHGTSHKFVAQKSCDLAGLDINKVRIVSCHLGNGGSVTAIENGKSLETSMGFTPVEGVVMGTRSGNVDVGIVTFLQEKEGLDAAEINSVLNKKSGFLGISGISSDCRDVEVAANEGDYRAQLTLEMFWHSIRKYVGAYTAIMGGVDLILFTGGIGENDDNTRKAVCSTLGYLGVEFDDSRNKGVRGEDKIISKDSSKVIVTTVTTNEELVIARDTMDLVKETIK